MRRWLLWLPLVAFVALAAVAVHGLYRPNDLTVRSRLVGKPLPDFALPPLIEGRPGVSQADFATGAPRLLNIFASWCVPCIAEAPHLLRLKAAGVPIDAVAIRDTAPAVRDFLARHGDPYARIGDDPRSAVQFALGSSGVPETFVIDGQGRIAMQHVGPINEADVPRILQALEDAR
ncbi:redoxin family protein [Sphingomonas baiyangensis]|uniref:Redoxin domain-containing protein n=1 Tax=Sphingomonas baiyangensis TaxID=2572576 RepID=A0A4U1L439_9SPHN|nr:redoxin family protein [Sphingomonas baiyangensis]TKD50963.1 redoxin domain-containing protein [Sphingomonas baiyangensis]